MSSCYSLRTSLENGANRMSCFCALYKHQTLCNLIQPPRLAPSLRSLVCQPEVDKAYQQAEGFNLARAYGLTGENLIHYDQVRTRIFGQVFLIYGVTFLIFRRKSPSLTP
jgi:hypothetical protein